jgi:type IV pilus assembly protein PilX
MHNTKFHHQRGVTLIVSMVMLLVILMISTSLADMALMGEKAARNERDKQVAMHAAESALADAEKDIENSSAANSRSAIFSPHSSEGFSEGCGRGDSNPYQGLCKANRSGQKAIWRTADIANDFSNGDSSSVPFGRFTGHTLPTGYGPFSQQLPRYLIELMEDAAIGQEAKTTYFYRITAIGFGTDRSTQVVLQSFYRKLGEIHLEDFN